MIDSIPRPRRRYEQALIAIVAAGLAAVCAGCSSSGSVSGRDEAASASTVTGALHRIHADSTTQWGFTFGDIAGMQQVDKGVSGPLPLADTFSTQS